MRDLIRGRAAGAVMGMAAAGMLAGSLALATASAEAAGPAGPRVPVLHWHGCHGGFQCATARVPLDYRHPGGS